jgi:hypothetical protein
MISAVALAAGYVERLRIILISGFLILNLANGFFG